MGVSGLRADDCIEHVIRTLSILESDPIMEASELVYKTIINGGWVYLAGNGGSGSIAEHMASDIMKGGGQPMRETIRCLSLGSNDVIIGAYVNDVGVSSMFAEQCYTYDIGKNDCIITFSASGKSKNILAIKEYAKEQKVPYVCLSSSKTKNNYGISIYVDTLCDGDMFYGVVEGVFSVLAHIIASIVKDKLRSSHGNLERRTPND